MSIVADGGTTTDPTLTVRVSLANTAAVAGNTALLYNGITPVGNPVALSATDISNGYVDISTPSLVDAGYAFNATITNGSGSSTHSANYTVTVSGGGVVSPPSSVLKGISLGPGDFGVGVMGTNYAYPTHAIIDYYSGKGMKIARFPFFWENIQRTLMGALDATDMAVIQDRVSYLTGKGVVAMIDLHNYGRYGGGGTGPLATNAQMSDVWTKLANVFKTNPLVWFELMNEPHDIAANTWFASANAIIVAIRATGATNKVVVSGTAWDSGMSWSTFSGNAAAALTLTDSANNYAFAIHQYFDNGTGTQGTVLSPTIGVERLTDVTNWAIANNKQLVYTEFSTPDTTAGVTTLQNTLNYVEANEEWIGWTYYYGGQWDTSSWRTIEPQNGVDKPKLAVVLG